MQASRTHTLAVCAVVALCATLTAASAPCNFTLSAPFSDLYGTVQGYMDAATDPYPLKVCFNPGNYSGCASGWSMITAAGYPVTIEGQGATKPVFYCHNSGRVINMTNANAQGYFSNIEVRYGSGNVTGDGRYPGGVARVTGGMLNISNSEFVSSEDSAIYAWGPNAVVGVNASVIAMCVNNRTDGGAIRATNGATVTVTSSQLTNNSAVNGGSIAVDGSGTSVSLTDSTVSRSEALDGGSGGGVYVTNNAALSVSGGRVSHNSGGVGGGVYASTTGMVSFDGGVVESNTASDGNGGAVYASGASVVSSETNYTDNTATSGRGGAVYTTGGSFASTDDVYEDNSAGVGGALALDSVSTASVASEFSGNTATSGNGGAVAATGTTTLTATHASFESNTATNGTGGALSVSGGGSASLTNSTFTTNFAMYGGAASATGTSTLSCTDTHFNTNNVTHDGGALYATDSGTTARIDGGSFTDNTASGSGGAVAVAASASGNITSSMFTTNTADGSGGACSSTSSATLTVTGGSATSNRASTNGGTYSTDDSGSVALVYTSVVSSWADGSGGAVSATFGSTASVIGTVFDDNSAAGDGGALSVSSFRPGSVSLDSTDQVNCTFVNRTFVNATFVNGTKVTNATWYNATYVNCTAVNRTTVVPDASAPSSLLLVASSVRDSSASGDGGAVHVTDSGSSANITTTNFTSCTAGGSGGSLSVDSGGWLTLVNSTVSHTDASGDGGALAVSDGSTAYVVECTAHTGTAGGSGGLGYVTGTNTELVSTRTSWEGGVAARDGGGLFVGGSAAAVLAGNSSIVDSSAGGSGGGLYVSSADPTYPTPLVECIAVNGTLVNTTMVNGTLVNGTVVNGTEVGGVYTPTRLVNCTTTYYTTPISVSGTNVTLLNSELTGNSASAFGGAAGVNNPGSTLVLSGVRVANNSAGDSGGGLYAGIGSALWVGDSSTVSLNNAATNGGAMYVSNITTTADIEASVQMVCNVAGVSGGALYADAGANVTLSARTTCNRVPQNLLVSVAAGIHSDGNGTVISVEAGTDVSTNFIVDPATGNFPYNQTTYPDDILADATTTAGGAITGFVLNTDVDPRLCACSPLNVTCDQPCRNGGTCPSNVVSDFFAEDGPCDCGGAARLNGFPNGDYCNISRCGDGIIVGFETCDDGDVNDNNGCNANCTVDAGWFCPAANVSCYEICGDGLLVGNETCDDNNLINLDGCNTNCTIETGWTCPTVNASCIETCGDGLIVGSEPCDDGGRESFDGCSSNCTVEYGWFCPSANVSCFEVCGDGLIVGNETCDDGNTLPDDGCTPNCTWQVGWFCPTFNGTYTYNTTNVTSGNDTVSVTEVTFHPHSDKYGDAAIVANVSCVEICGDDLLVGDEECDDGNTVELDGCSRNCSVEAGWFCPIPNVTTPYPPPPPPPPSMYYGNGTNYTMYMTSLPMSTTPMTSTSSPSSTSDTGLPKCISICGDGLVVGREACDDGNRKNGDGCENNCNITQVPAKIIPPVYCLLILPCDWLGLSTYYWVAIFGGFVLAVITLCCIYYWCCHRPWKKERERVEAEHNAMLKQLDRLHGRESDYSDYSEDESCCAWCCPCCCDDDDESHYSYEYEYSYEWST